MIKQLKKKSERETENYILGEEDGFFTIGEAIINGWQEEGYTHPICAKYRGIPYIKTKKGVEFISEGDVVIQSGVADNYKRVLMKLLLFDKKTGLEITEGEEIIKMSTLKTKLRYADWGVQSDGQAVVFDNLGKYGYLDLNVVRVCVAFDAD